MVSVSPNRTTHIISLKLNVVLVASLAASLCAADTITTNQVGQGVVYKHYHYDNLAGGKQEVYVTDVNLNDPAVSIRFPYLTAKRTVSAHAATVPSAAVAINGQFFDSSGSVQFLKVSGSVVYPSRANVHDEQAITDDGLGHTNSVRISLRPGGINSWTNSTWPNILACGVELVKNGLKIPDSGYDPNDAFVTAENPRTCVAWTYDNHLLLVCVDGRSANAHGMSIYELRDDLYTRGSIRHAFSLDGGGSTEMWARGIGVCNVPSDGHERPVTDAIVVAAAALTLPAPPTNLVATLAITNVSLSWSPSSSAMSYNLKRSVTNGGPYSTVLNTAATSYTNTGLAPGTTFYYVVSALNSVGESSNSVQVAATTASVPPAPGHLTATPGDRWVSLDWDAVPGVVSYRLKRSSTDGGSYTVIANLISTAYTNSGLANGTTYYYVVSAVNGAGESTNSSQAFATPQCVVPPAPAGLVATLSNGQIALSWNPAAGAANYAMYRSSALAGPYTALATNLTVTNYLDATFDSGAVSFYVVRAMNACGASADSSVASAPLRLMNRAVSGTNVVLSGWGGTAGQSYYVLGSANLAAPVSQWTRLVTNIFGAGGSFSFTNAINPAWSQQFYLIQATNDMPTGEPR